VIFELGDNLCAERRETTLMNTATVTDQEPSTHQQPSTVAQPLELTATFDDPGVFPKYLTKIGEVLLFLDLASIVALTDNGRSQPATFFGWILNEELKLQSLPDKGNATFPEAPQKSHTGEKLMYLMKVGDGIKVPLSYEFHGLRAAGRVYDSGWTLIDFGPYAIGEKFIVWKMADRHQRAISDAAETYSDSK